MPTSARNYVDLWGGSGCTVHQSSENASDVELCLVVSKERESHNEEADTERDTEANEGHFAAEALHWPTDQQSAKYGAQRR